MHPSRLAATGLACLALLTPVRAEAPPSPLRLIPDQADLVLEVRQPRRLADTLTGLDAWKQLQQFSAVQEALSGTKARRLYQLTAHLERELGAPWPDLLDRLAGGGAALGVKLGSGPAGVAVIQGRDAALTRKFLDVIARLTAEELARRESKGRVERHKYHEIEVVRLGDVVAAAAGSALVVANRPEALQRALDLHRGEGGKGLAGRAALAEAARLLPADPLVHVWLDMETVRKNGPARELTKRPRDSAQLTVLIGGYLDALARTPWLAAGLGREGDGFRLTVRLPVGRDGMGPERDLFTPHNAAPGSRPLLEPKGVLYSDSSFLDFSRIWDDRARLFNEAQVKGLEKLDEGSGRFLSGMRLSKLLGQAGAYYRFVVAHQPTVSYASRPRQPLPAFAVVVEMREPEAFAQAMETVLRGAALLSLSRVKLKLVEEKHAGCDVVGWRFDESAPLPQDVNDVRFNFSPCFARVGNQFVVSSTLELGRELIDLLKKEQAAGEAGAPPTARKRLYSAGAADLLQAAKLQLLAQTILDQALPPDAARTQVEAFIALVRRLGTLDLEATFGDRDFRYDIRLRAGK